MDLQRNYDEWVAKGEPRDANGSVDHEIKEYYLWREIQRFDLKVLVESGTSYGDTVASLSPHVNAVYTMEAWQEAFDFASERFSGDSSIEVLFGDSGTLLPKVLGKLNAPALFWLDAHYSGDGTAMLTKQTPIIEELEAIAACPKNIEDVIVIDDARGFGVWPDYPAIDWLEKFCADKFPDHKFYLEADEIFLEPIL